MRLSAHAALTAMICSCSTSTGPGLGDEFELRVGESIALEEVGLWLAFVRVDQDSRCARQTTCVWAGDATVLVETAPLPDALVADSKTDTLHTHLDPKYLELGAVELLLMQLDPYPEAPLSIPSDAYVATFTVRKPS